MVKRPGFAALAIGASLMTSPALAAGSPFVGTWKTVATTEQGQYQATMTVAEVADGYTIQIVEVAPGQDGLPGMPVPSTVSEVKVDGASFSFKRTIEFQGQKFEFAYAGTVDGDRLTASASSDFGATPVTGTRQ